MSQISQVETCLLVNADATFLTVSSVVSDSKSGHYSHLSRRASSMKTVKSKPKSCYNCTKRRIICDGTEPYCRKCEKKGLSCPGFGKRYRFKDGLTNEPGSPPIPQSQARQTYLPVPNHLTWVAYQHGEDDFDEDVLEENETRLTIAPIHKSLDFMSDPLIGNLYPLDSEARYLFSHCGSHPESLDICLTSTVDEHVSVTMVVFDGPSNGYRHYILPMAASDATLRRAVSVASAFHLSSSRPEFRELAVRGRQAIIQNLQKSVMVGNAGDIFNEKTWATIMLLIIADLISGHPDVFILYNMLQSFLTAWNDRSNDTMLAHFLEYQSSLIEHFATPMIKESDGLTNLDLLSDPIRTIESQGSDPQTDISLLLYNEAFKKAQMIYSDRVKSAQLELDEEVMAQKVKGLELLLCSFDLSARGAHSLVWPYFVAAAESKSEDHRKFFLEKLEEIWSMTGYQNVLVATNALQNIWKSHERWTAMLPRIGTVIM